eukprot:3564959-Amphidinium_carterae.1
MRAQAHPLQVCEGILTEVAIRAAKVVSILVDDRASFCSLHILPCAWLAGGLLLGGIPCLATIPGGAVSMGQDR